MISNPVYKLYEFLLENSVKKGKIPEHIAIIMDGNRRLARRIGLAPWEGHRLGAKKLEDVLEWCIQLGIKSVTTYAFSTDNFKRPQEEKERLFDLFTEEFKRIKDDPKIHENRVKIKIIGQLEDFPRRVKEEAIEAEKATKNYDNLTLNIALAYGGREEIVDAVKKIANEVRNESLKIAEINEQIINQNLYTNGSKDPDLIIRTSGEERISGFLLWQSAYSEFYFCESYWPGFRKIDFLRAIRTYQQRKRRFGQ